MPPAVKRHCTVLILDMHTDSPEMYKHTFELLLTCQMLIKTKDHVQVYALNVTGDRGYSIGPSFDIVTNVQVLMDFVNQQRVKLGARWTQSVLGAINGLNATYGKVKNILTKHIVLLSDLNNCTLDGFEIDRIVRQSRVLGIKLTFIGVDIEPPTGLIKTVRDLPKWMRQLKLDESSDNQMAIRYLIEQLPGQVLVGPINNALHLFKWNQNGRTLQPFLKPLKFTRGLQLSVTTMKSAQKDVLKPKLKRRVNKRTGVRGYRTKYDHKPVRYEGVIRGRMIQNLFVPRWAIPYYKPSNERALDLICFSKQSRIPKAYHRGQDSFQMKALPKCKRTFAALVQALIERQMCAIVKRIYIRNTKPKYFCLWPRVHYRNSRTKTCPRYYFRMFLLPYRHQVVKRVVEVKPVMDREPSSKVLEFMRERLVNKGLMPRMEVCRELPALAELLMRKSAPSQ